MALRLQTLFCQSKVQIILSEPHAQPLGWQDSRTKYRIFQFHQAASNLSQSFLKHHWTTLNLNKCKWLQDMCDFVQMDMSAGRTQLAYSKTNAFAKLEIPNTLSDLHMLIGLFVLYRQFFYMICTVRMKILTIFSGALYLLHQYRSNLAHLLTF